MACQWCGNKQTVVEEGNICDCMVCYILYNEIKNNLIVAEKIVRYLKRLKNVD